MPSQTLKEQLDSLAAAADARQREYNAQLAREQEFERIKQERLKPKAEPKPEPKAEAKPEAKPEPESKPEIPEIFAGSVHEISPAIARFLGEQESQEPTTPNVRGKDSAMLRVAQYHMKKIAREKGADDEVVGKIDDLGYVVGALAFLYVCTAIEKALIDQAEGAPGLLITSKEQIKKLLK